MQAFAVASRKLKHAFVRGKDYDVASGIQNGRAYLAVLKVPLNIEPNVLRQRGIQIFGDVTPNVFAFYNHGSHLFLWAWVDTLQEWAKLLLQHHVCPMKSHFDTRDADAERFCGFLDAEFLNIAELKDLAINCREADNCFLKHPTNFLPLHGFRRDFAPLPNQSRRHNASVIGRISTFRAESKFGTWLISITLNACAMSSASASFFTKESAIM
jgi:hypothetical protein